MAPAGGAATAMRSFWETVNGGFAHIDYKAPNHHSEAAVIQRWRTQWLDAWLAQLGGHWLRGRRVGDYGIGGGLLGELLCREYGISHYVGFDVARRQLDLARRRLSNAGCSHELVLVDSSRGDATDFVPHQLDALVSQQVIQHFPSRSYTEAWLRAVATAEIPRLLLEVRYNANPHQPRHEVRFNEWGPRVSGGRLPVHPVQLGPAVQMGTVLHCEWLHARLPRYRYAWSSNATTSRRFKACAFERARRLGEPMVGGGPARLNGEPDGNRARFRSLGMRGRQ